MADTAILLRVEADSAQLKKLANDFAVFKEQIGNATKGAARLGSELNAMAAIKFSAAVTVGSVGVISALQGIRSALTGALVEGVRFNASLETASVSVAGVLRTFRPDQYRTFQDAVKASTAVIDELKRKALETPATFQELLVGFQGTAGAMMSANIPLSKQVGLVVEFSRAMAALGVHSQELRQELNAVLTGQIDRQSRVARVLQITSEDIAGARAKGELLEFITGKLSGISEAASYALNNIALLESNLKDTSSQAAAKATTGLADSYRELLKAMTDLVKSPAVGNLLSSAATGASKIVDAATATARAVAAPGNLEQAEGIASGVAASVLAFKLRSTFTSLHVVLNKVAGLFVNAACAIGTFLLSASAPVLALAVAIGLLVTNANLWLQVAALKAETGRDQWNSDDARRKALSDAMDASKDPAQQAWIAAEAQRRSIMLTRQADEARRGGDDVEATRLATLARQYGLILATKKKIGAELLAANAYEAEQAKLADETIQANQKRAEESKALAADYDKNLDAEKKARFAAMADEAKLLELKRLQVEATAALRLSPSAESFGKVDPATGKITVSAENEVAASSARLEAATRLLEVNHALADMEAKIERARDARVKKETEDAKKAAQLAIEVSLRKQDDAAKVIERAQDAEIAQIKENKFVTERERKAKLYNAYLAQELNLKERIKIAEGLRDVAVSSDPNSSNATHAQDRVDALKTQKDVTLPAEIATNKPTSIFDEVRIEMKNLQDGFATIATTIGGVMRSAIDGVAGSISGLLKCTMSWGDALRNIGGSIINSVIDGISRMFAEWIVGIAARKTAEVAAGAAETAAKTPGALMTSISSFGVAAALGLAALVAAMAMFDKGGFTGTGGRNEVAGIVHKGEVVFSQDNVSRLGGVAAVEALRVSGGNSGRGAGVSLSAASGGLGGPAIGGSSGSGVVINQAYFNCRQDAATWLASQKGRRIATDWLRGQSYDL